MLELLCCIGIIATLAAILYPVFGIVAPGWRLAALSNKYLAIHKRQEGPEQGHGVHVNRLPGVRF